MSGLAISGVNISWAAVKGSTGYDVKRNGKVVTSTKNALAASGLTVNDGDVIEVVAKPSGQVQGPLVYGLKPVPPVTPPVVTPPVPPPAGSNPVPPPKNGAYIGAYVDGVSVYTALYGGVWSNAPLVDPGTQDAWAKFETTTGKKLALLMFGAGGHSFLLDSFASVQPGLDAVVARGAVPVLDMMGFDASRKTSDARNGYAANADVAAGKYDAQIKAFAQAAKAWGKPFVLRFDCEMNGSWYGYGLEASTDPATFVAAWRHCHDIFTAVGASNVSWHWCPNYDPDGSHTPLASLYPGDDYVDWTGFQLYNHGDETFAWGALGAGAKMSTYGTIAKIAPSKPMMLGEVGSVDAGYPGQKTKFIADLFAGLPSMPLVRALCWFNFQTTEHIPPWDWQIESSPASIAAFKAAIASSYYVGRA